MPYEATYNYSVLTLLAARTAGPNCSVMVFLRRQQCLVDEMNARWTDATFAAGLPTPRAF
jgi:hypothetical protein